MKIIKRLIFGLIFLVLIAVLGGFGYITYVNSNSSKAKDYLLYKYDIKDKDWVAYKYVEYVYEDIADCETLWLKKCTDDENVVYKYTFINKKKEEIVVTEDKMGNFTDDYNGKTTDKYNEDLEKKKAEEEAQKEQENKDKEVQENTKK